jgi:hypothetical protein
MKRAKLTLTLSSKSPPAGFVPRVEAVTPVLREGWPALSEIPLARRRSTDAGPWRYDAADQWRRDSADPSEWNECENVPGTPRTFRVD